MSLKENVNFVKNEINNEEKFLESFVKLERFYKKNKILIISVFIIVIISIIGISIKKYIDNQNKIEANIAFNKVLDNNNDKESLEVLKQKNQKLYEIATYIIAKKQNKTVQIDVEFFKSLTKYQEALKEQNIQKLNDVSMQKEFLLKEFAIFNKALIEAKNGKYEDSKNTLKLVPTQSSAYELVKILNHYLLTK